MRFEEDREAVDLTEKRLLAEKKNESIACGGHCCRRFRFRKDQPPEAFWEEYERAMKGGWPTRDDIHIVAPMLIHLGYSYINGNGKWGEEPSHWYSCKHLNTMTGLCTIYEHRPALCRNHGAKGFSPCLYDRCGAKEGSHDRSDAA